MHPNRKRRNRSLFLQLLVRPICGTPTPTLGVVDSKTGDVLFHFIGKPRMTKTSRAQMEAFIGGFTGKPVKLKHEVFG